MEVKNAMEKTMEMFDKLMSMKPQTEADAIDKINNITHDFGLDMVESIKTGNILLTKWHELNPLTI